MSLRGGRGLAAESVWGLAIELVAMLGMMLTFTFLGRSLGPVGYGGYASLYAIVSPLVTLAASGVTLALLQHVVRDHESLAETARSCLSLSIALGVLLTGIGALVAMTIVDTLTTVAIVAILLTEFVTTPLVYVAAAAVQAGTGFIGAAKIRLVLLCCRVFIVIALFAADSLSVASLGVATLISSGVVAVMALRSVGRRYAFRFVPGRVHARHLRTNVVYSVGISASALTTDGDKAVLAANKFVVDTGLYAAAFRIVNLGMIPITSLVTVSHRRFLEHEHGVPGQHLRRAIKFTRFSAIYSLAFVAVILVAAPLLPVLVGDEFEGSVNMVRWLCPFVVLRAAATFPLNGLMGLNRTFLRSVIIVGNAVLSMSIYLLFIPRYGWEGAAAGTLIAEVVLLVSTWSALVACQRQADRRELAVVV